MPTLPGENAIKKVLAERHLRHFIAQAWEHVEPGTQYVGNWHIDAICEHLEAVSRHQITRLIINIPPRHMKSLTCAVFWPVWDWINAPHTRFLFSSYAQTLSVRDNLKARRLIESPWYQANWSDKYSLAADQNQKTRYDTNKGGFRLATSVGGALTGEGGDKVVIDDPISAMDTHSEAVRTSTLQWWDEAMSTRLNDKKTGAFVIIMQRLHEEDLTGHIIARETGWDHLCLPQEYESKHPHPIVSSLGFKDPRKEEGELLWPEREGPKEIEELKRRLGSMAAAGQLQQRPSPAEGGMIKRSWWKFYDELPAKWDKLIMSWDCAFKDSEKNNNDFVVGQVWGLVGADAYLVDQVRARMDFPSTVEAVKSLCAKHPQVSAKLIEEKANGAAVIQTLTRKIPGIKAINPEGGKESRVAAVSPFIESGNVFLPNKLGRAWVDDLIEECAKFPAAAHDDQVDSMSQALNWLHNKSVVKGSVKQTQQGKQL